MNTDGLAMFTNGTDTVIARDTDDAWVVWSEQIGEDRDDYDGEWSWEAVPGDKAIKAWLDPDGTVGCPDDDGAELVSKTVDEWITHLGRGFAWSTEY